MRPTSLPCCRIYAFLQQFVIYPYGRTYHGLGALILYVVLFPHDVARSVVAIVESIAKGLSCNFDCLYGLLAKIHDHRYALLLPVRRRHILVGPMSRTTCMHDVGATAGPTLTLSRVPLTAARCSARSGLIVIL